MPSSALIRVHMDLKKRLDKLCGKDYTMNDVIRILLDDFMPERGGVEDMSELDLCPICGNYSLVWHPDLGIYTCLNPECDFEDGDEAEEDDE